MISKKLMLLIFLVPLICGCVSQTEPQGKGLKVVTTILPYEEIIKSVGGDRVQVTVMIPPGAEPHTFEPTPSEIKQIADADVYIENGAGLETWLQGVINVNREMLVVDSSKGIDLIRGSGEGESGSEFQGADPHTWVSVRNAEVIVRNVCDGLIQADPSNRDYYLLNRDDYLGKIRAADTQLNTTFAGTSRKKFIVLHPAWSYFARDYGLEEIAINAEEKEPGPKYIAEVIDTARKNGIRTVFAEPEYSPKSAEVIARELGGAVVSLDPLAENYLENMLKMGREIAQS